MSLKQKETNVKAIKAKAMRMDLIETMLLVVWAQLAVSMIVAYVSVI